MLVQITSLGGVAVVGTKDIMAISRACVYSFAGIRKLHPFRSISSPSIWPRPAIERIVHHCPTSSMQLRFSAHAAALEEVPEQHHTRGRLSRAERYVLVENFIMKHKDSHEGKWPSVNAIVKEIGGSRLIVKDIVEELEKNSKMQMNAESFGNGSSGSTNTLSAPGIRHESGLAAENIREESRRQETLVEPENGRSVDDLQTIENPPVSSNSEPVAPTMVQTKSTSDQFQNVEAEPGLWRRLRDLGQETYTGQGHGQSLSVFPFDSDDTESDADMDDEPEILSHTEGHDTQPQERLRSHLKSSSGHVAENKTSENYGLFIRFLPRSASEADLRAAFQDCGEIVRAQAMVPKGSGIKFTYGFVDFNTQESLNKALKKEKVFIKGSAVLTEACSSQRKSDSRSARKSVLEHFKKADTSVNSGTRPPNGYRNPEMNNRFRRVTVSQAISDNGSRPPSSEDFHLVVVEGLPYPMPISGIEKMLSAHGEIARSELAREDGGTYSAQVEFKTQEARDSALASNRLYLGGRWCRVTTGEPILTTVVRLSNIGNASSNFVLQKCAKIGRVESIVQRNQGLVDVYYHSSERRNMRKILDRLNDVNADFRRWHANPAPKCSMEEIQNFPEVQNWVGAQKDKLLVNLTSTMKLMITDLEDLRELVDIERSEPYNTGSARLVDRMAAPKLHRP